MADCIAAQVAHEQAVEQGTHEKKALAWCRWTEYMVSIGIKDDDFLENFSQEQGHFVGEARITKTSHDPLAVGTVRGTMQYVSAIFWENGYSSPTLNKDGQLAWILQKEFWSFKNLDPAKRHQAAILLSVITEINKQNSSELEQATAQLVALAIFFAMHSCEYLKVHQLKQQRTEIVRICNIRFFRRGEQLDHNYLKLEYADCISVTFERQKKRQKNEYNHPDGFGTLWPVRSAVAILKRIKKYPGTSQNSPISTVSNHGIIEHVTSDHVKNVLQDAVGAIDEV